MNVLVIAPHPDDEAIGCGGTLCKHAARGERIRVVFLTSGEKGLKNTPKEKVWKIRELEAKRSLKTLGVAKADFLRLPDSRVCRHINRAARLLRPIVQSEKLELIYLPHPNEWHVDHKAALPILHAVFRHAGHVPLLRGYEVWTPIGEAHHIEDITNTMARKLRAIRAYRSQFAEIDYARAANGLNAYRGEMSARFRYAEVFQNLQI